MKFPFILTTVAILGVTSANAASYNDEINNFSIRGSASSANSISFPNDGVAIRRLAGDIRENTAALAQFEEKLFAGLCLENQGTINWNYNDTGIQVQCSAGVRSVPDSKKIFREAHCAGFCVLHGSGFKKFEYNASINDYDCICKSGNARNLGATETTQTVNPDQPPYDPESMNMRKKDRSLKKVQRLTDKEKECASRTPPMDVKRNVLGMWVCTRRDTQNQSNAAVKQFWDDMNAAEEALNKRIKELLKAGA